MHHEFIRFPCDPGPRSGDPRYEAKYNRRQTSSNYTLQKKKCAFLLRLSVCYRTTGVKKLNGCGGGRPLALKIIGAIPFEILSGGAEWIKKNVAGGGGFPRKNKQIRGGG